MKHTYTDTELQAAINAAFPVAYYSSLVTRTDSYLWHPEETARFAIARAFLDNLPEPTPLVVDGKTPGQVAFEAWGNEPDEWHKSLTSNWQSAASAVLAAFGKSDLDAAIARMEAVDVWDVYTNYTSPFSGEALSGVKSHLIAAAREGQAEASQLIAAHTPLAAKEWAERWQQEADARNAQFKELQNWKAKHDADFYEKSKALFERAEKAEAELAKAKEIITSMAYVHLSQLRPLSEAGPVPEGCVRMTGFKSDMGRGWCLGELPANKDTHYADLRLPAEEKPLVNKPDDSSALDTSVNENVEKITQPTEEIPWTPVAGDVVQLKSGGPVMTVGCSTEHTTPSVSCAWFDGATLYSTPIPTACLQPA